VKLSQVPKRNPFLSNAFFIFLSRFFPSLANLLVISYYSRHLDTTLYGTYSNFWINLNLLYPLACLGIHLLVFTYKPDFIVGIARRISGRQYAVYGFWLILIGGIFALLQWPSLHTVAIPLLFLVVYSATLIMEACLMVGKKFSFLVSVNLLFSILYWAIHKYIFQSSFSLQHLFAALLALTVFRLFLYAVVTARIFKKEGHANEQLFDVKKVRTLWLFLALYDVVQNYSGWIDKFIVAHTLDSRSSGIYYNGSLNIPFLPLLLGAALSAVLIDLSESKDIDDTPRILGLMNKTGKVMSCIVFPLFFFLLLYRYQVVVLLLSGKYIAAIPVFLVSLLVMPLRAYSFTSILQRRHQGAIINKGALADIIIGCLLIYPLYQCIGLPGVALSFVISTYMQAIYYLYHTARVLRVKWPQLVPLKNWLVKLAIFALLAGVLHFITAHYFTDVIGVILGAITTMAIILLALWAEIKHRETNGTTS
jgi:O-antigen/teichoic acid export membrane protein